MSGNTRGNSRSSHGAVSLYWNALVGWFVAVAFRRPAPFSSLKLACRCRPGLSSLGATLGTHRNDEIDAIDVDHETTDAINRFGCQPEIVDAWSSSLWWSLKLDFFHVLCSKELKEELFAEDTNLECFAVSIGGESDDDCSGNEDTSGCQQQYRVESDIEWIVRGIPERPLYREVAKRLLEWNRQHYSLPSASAVSSDETRRGNYCAIVPAETLGFKELDDPPSALISNNSPPQSMAYVSKWLSSCLGGGDSAICGLLGIRSTVGSLRPDARQLSFLPSRKTLLEASNVLLAAKSKDQRGDRLSLAAKARAKHAHRALQEKSYFGIVKGPVLKQNREASELVQKLLEVCVWTNCHIFSGLPSHKKHVGIETKKESDDQFSAWVLEIRQEQGYGARWLVEKSLQAKESEHEGPFVETTVGSNNNRLKVTFRGFLEPQMEDGHERRWRH